MAMPLSSCVAQEPRARPNLYQCEGCDAVFERDPATLTSTSDMASLEEPRERLIITGRVFASDGKTPVSGVIIYAYQTNDQGLYANGTPETEWSRRHGRIRGWVKTDKDGIYRFNTIKPAPYPDRPFPAHIHLTVLEDGMRPYWIDDIVFEGEFGVTPQYKQKMTHQGGDGVSVLTTTRDGIWFVVRDIYLEHHP